MLFVDETCSHGVPAKQCTVCSTFVAIVREHEEPRVSVEIAGERNGDVTYWVQRISKNGSMAGAIWEGAELDELAKRIHAARALRT